MIPQSQDRSPAGGCWGSADSVPEGAAGHVPVLLEPVLDVLAPRDGAVYVDATFGAGGYAEALLEAAHCRVFAIDRDPDAVARGRVLAERHGGRLTVIEGLFGDMAGLLAPFAPGPVAGIVFDLGVSSFQLDTPERGFSFRFDGPLDMRMGRQGTTAADLIASLSEDELTRLIHEFGQERFARRVSRAIKAAERRRAILTTSELAEIVRSVVPKSEPGQDPATRTFQALRIAVNDELAELERGLIAAERLLAPGGRLAVVSFHSLEDRLVKQFLQQRSGQAPRASRHAPDAVAAPAASFELLGRRAVRPSAVEIARNPRARAARMRAARRTTASAWSADADPLGHGRREQEK
jgi:16S rRNA (cytosine1402-N4)-methyltransferase